MKLAFHFRPVPFIATLLLIILGCSLSYWQTQRAHQKEALEALLQSRENRLPVLLPGVVQLPEMEFTKVALSGEFLTDWTVYLENRPMDGNAGFYVVTPFRLSDTSKIVLVERGWVPRNQQDRTKIKSFDTPSGTVHIVGALQTGVGRVYQLGAGAAIQPQAILQNLDPAEFAQASRLTIEPYVVQQVQAGFDDGLQRDWPRASMGSERHRGYAFQWMALAIMALLFFVFTGFRKKK